MDQSKRQESTAVCEARCHRVSEEVSATQQQLKVASTQEPQDTDEQSVCQKPQQVSQERGGTEEVPHFRQHIWSCYQFQLVDSHQPTHMHQSHTRQTPIHGTFLSAVDLLGTRSD